MKDKPLVEIDLNVRVEGGRTYAGLEDVCGGPVAAGDEVVAVEPESGARFAASVVLAGFSYGLLQAVL